EVKDLKVEEAGLTGESVPVQKKQGVLVEDTGLGDRENMAFAGSAVTYGQAQGVVVATGDETEAGHIAKLMGDNDTIVTTLTRKVAGLSKVLVWLILGLAFALLVVQWLRGADLA